MPNTASAKKRLKQNVLRRGRNRSIKSAVRTQLRKLRTAIDAGDVDECAANYRLAVKKLDQAAARNVIHANTAARTKSRLCKAIKAVQNAG